jgi:diguanylate cyclase (GGDEF)-like protein
MRTPPRRLAALADRLLSREPVRRIRVVQTGVAILFSVAALVAMLYAAWAGFAAWSAVGLWAGLVLGGCVGFFVAIRSGWSERFADPALTVAQMVYATTCCAVAYAITGAMRGAIFPLVMVVMMFGMFALPTRQVLGVSLYAVLVFGAAMGALAHWRPHEAAPAVEWGHFLMLAAMMPAVSLLAERLHHLRLRLQRRKEELAEALDRIQFLATRDELTGLVNRREIGALLDKEGLRSVRNGTHFCVALIDLDHFKRINDQHGHGAGDAALRAFAQEATRLVRATDSIGRWGGEEFMLVMPDSALPAAREGVERLRRALERLEIRFDDMPLELTLSAGVVQHEDAEPVPRTVERADRALYVAKASGRNAVVVG